MAVRRSDGAVGYFDVSKSEVPNGWQYANYEDISDVMVANKMGKREVLILMNQHWQIP